MIVYGWVLEHEVACAACTGIDYYDTKLDILLGENGPSPLNSIDNTGTRGLACDIQTSEDCTGWIFPPCCDTCAATDDDLARDEDVELVYQDDSDIYLCTRCIEKEQD